MVSKKNTPSPFFLGALVITGRVSSGTITGTQKRNTHHQHQTTAHINKQYKNNRGRGTLRKLKQNKQGRPLVPEREAYRMSRSARWPYVRRMAWNRDRKARSSCHICGQPINYFLQPSSCDDAWEPDHILPVARYPEAELDLNNIRASHRRCNRARGDGTNGENNVGMQSRIW